MAAVADKSTDKSTKNTSRNTSKVFDVSKPNRQPSSATSRPVIISNRPVMPDPMMVAGLNQSVSDSANAETMPPAETESSQSPSKVKMTIQPLGAGETDSPKAEAKPESPVDVPTDSIELTETDPPPPAEVDTTPVEAKPVPTDADKSSDDLPLESEQTKDEKETAALEAAAKKQAELDTLVESKEFFLPINSVERRRSKLVTILGIALIVALGLLLINLMLDAGFVRIPGVSPLTHFFSS